MQVYIVNKMCVGKEPPGFPCRHVQNRIYVFGGISSLVEIDFLRGSVYGIRIYLPTFTK